MEPGKYRFSFTIGLTLILFACGVILSVIYFNFPEIRSQFIFLLKLGGGLTAIYSAFFVGESLKSRIDFDRKTKTFEFVQKFDHLDFSKMLADFDIDFDSDKIPQSDVYGKIMANKELYRVVRALLNLCEDISIAIQREYIDESIAHNSVNKMVCSYVKKLTPYIDGINAKYHTTTLYEQARKLANAWESNKYLSNGAIIEGKR